MIKFENKYFRKFNFSKNQIRKYLDSAYKDLKIAKNANIAEVKFQFTYNAFIKLGISLIACYGYKVKSRLGHHIKILEKMSEILKNEDVLMYGNEMRKTRNIELYDGGSTIITNKQAKEYLDFIEKIFDLSKGILKKHLGTLF
ncbi:MAG: hypothetical protein AB1643_01650 [Patescibacteria group bacterium]